MCPKKDRSIQRSTLIYQERKKCCYCLDIGRGYLHSDPVKRDATGSHGKQRVYQNLAIPCKPNTNTIPAEHQYHANWTPTPNQLNTNTGTNWTQPPYQPSTNSIPTEHQHDTNWTPIPYQQYTNWTPRPYQLNTKTIPTEHQHHTSWTPYQQGL